MVSGPFIYLAAVSFFQKLQQQRAHFSTHPENTLLHSNETQTGWRAEMMSIQWTNEWGWNTSFVEKNVNLYLAKGLDFIRKMLKTKIPIIL